MKSEALSFFVASFGSCMYIPSCTFAAHHFKKYRHLALIIPTVTGASPFLTIPPLIALLLEKFGWREATLVIAAMSMQVLHNFTLLHTFQNDDLES